MRADARTFGLGACAALSGAALASVPRGSSLAFLAAGAVVGLALGLWAARDGAPSRPVGRLELLALAAAAAALLAPVLSMAVAPGADMAMHAALGRSLSEGSPALSPAWGPVSVALYPRGLSAVIALFVPVVGVAKASLLAAGLAHLVAIAGLAAFLAEVPRLRHPLGIAVLAVLASKVPQGFFDWGGNPTALAFGLSLFAVALLARSWPEKEGAKAARVGLGASLLLLGAAATHPTGALAGVFAAAALFALGRPSRAGFVACAVAAMAFGAGLIALRLGGPQVSAAETSWIADYQRDVEAVLHGPRALFAVEIFRGMAWRLGSTWTAISALAAIALLAAGFWRRVVGSVVAVLAIGALLAVGPLIPGAGVLFYPLRFAPLLLVATAPLVGWTVEALTAKSRWLSGVAIAGLLVAGAVVHARSYQRARPMATRNDLQVVACAAREVPKDAVVEGAYGDAAQWLPALAGLRVTMAHPHISLNDEIRAEPSPPPSYRFVGERLRYGAPFAGPLPEGAMRICEAGGAALYRLPR